MRFTDNHGITIGEQRGMLYFHLLLARLEAREDIGRPSFERPRLGTPDGPHREAGQLR